MELPLYKFSYLFSVCYLVIYTFLQPYGYVQGLSFVSIGFSDACLFANLSGFNKKTRPLCSVCVVHYVGSTRDGWRRGQRDVSVSSPGSVRMRGLHYCLHFLLMLFFFFFFFFSRAVMALLTAGTDALFITHDHI